MNIESINNKNQKIKKKSIKKYKEHKNNKLNIGGSEDNNIMISRETFEKDYELVENNNGQTLYRNKNDPNSEYLYLLNTDFYEDGEPITINVPEEDEDIKNRLGKAKNIFENVKKNNNLSSIKTAQEEFMKYCTNEIIDENGKSILLCDESVNGLINNDLSTDIQRKVTFAEGPRVYTIPSQEENMNQYILPYTVGQYDTQMQYIQPVQGQPHQYIQPVQGQPHQYIQPVQEQPQQYIQQVQGQPHQYIQQVQWQPHQYIQPVYDQQHLVNNSLYDSANSTISTLLSQPVNAITSQQEPYVPPQQEPYGPPQQEPYGPEILPAPELVPRVLPVRRLSPTGDGVNIPVDNTIYGTREDIPGFNMNGKLTSMPRITLNPLAFSLGYGSIVPGLRDPESYQGRLTNYQTTGPRLYSDVTNDLISTGIIHGEHQTHGGGKIKNKSKLLFRDLLNDPNSKYVKYMNTLYLKINNQLLSVNKLYEFINSKDVRVKKEVKAKK